MTGASDQEAREFADAFRTFLMWVHAAQSSVRNEVAALVGEFIGDGVSDRSVVSRSLRPFEHVNLQTALDAWSRELGREVAVHGISVPPHHGAASLQQIIAGDGIGQLRLSAPALIDLPNGPGSTLACLQFAVLLVSDAAGRYVVLISGPMEQHEPTLTVEIATSVIARRQSQLEHRLCTSEPPFRARGASLMSDRAECSFDQGARAKRAQLGRRGQRDGRDRDFGTATMRWLERFRPRLSS